MPLSTNPELAYSEHASTALSIYRWVDPETDCRYPFLATTRDRSTSLLLGNYEACFELVPSGETKRWLPGFVSTRGRVTLELAGLCEIIASVYRGRADCGIVQFDEQLQVAGLKLVLLSEDENYVVDVEYVIRAFGTYERWERESDEHYRVSPAEEAMLQVCSATFEVLAKRVPEALREPPPPRYREGRLAADAVSS